MKKIYIILSISSILGLASCGGNKSDKLSSDSTNMANQGAATHQSEAVQETTVTNIGTEKTAGGTNTTNNPGAQLIAKADCLGCHKEHEKLVGPAYADVAKKYKSTTENIAMLANKIIKGGAGNWGDVPMTPHPNLSETDAKEMASYVLSLK